MTPRNLLGEWAGLLIESLADAGIRDVVVSPGSRSTPFVLAAASCPRLRCHDAIDERAAAFFALGQARVTGRPSLLLCTSGTAGAHYLPALLEASYSHVPVLSLTADRPHELQGCAAPQTIDQARLLGEAVRRAFDLGPPEPSEDALVALRRVAAQAVLATRHPLPGPVHMNARARKPLEPLAPRTDEELALAARAREVAKRPIPRPHPPRLSPSEEAVAELAEAFAGGGARRGLIACGPAPLLSAEDRRALLALAAATGFPLLPEAASQLRFTRRGSEVRCCDAFDLLLRDPALRAEIAPDLILQIGAPPTSSSFDAFLRAEASKTRRFVLAAHGWNDPQSRADALVLAPPGETARRLLDALGAQRPGPGPGIDPGFQRLLGQAEAGAWRAVAALLDEEPDGELAVVRAAVAALPRGALLALGNSLPIREVDAVCPGALCEVDVLSQRGVSGIDGLVSGAAGAASRAGRPVALLCGDVSFLHDLSGLSGLHLAQGAASSGSPLAIVVINNGGGRIFETLPVAAAADPSALRRFTTPHEADLSGAARIFGLPFARVHGAAALRAELSRALADGQGATLIEAVVEAGSAARGQRRLNELLKAEVRA